MGRGGEDTAGLSVEALTAHTQGSGRWAGVGKTIFMDNLQIVNREQQYVGSIYENSSSCYQFLLV